MYTVAYMKSATDFFRLLGETTRYRLLQALSHGEFCVCELVDALAVPQYTVSRHLAELRKGGWVTERRDGTWIYYRLAPARAKLVHDVLESAARNGLADKQLDKDKARLKKRLSLREKGRCVLGYDEL